MITSKQPLIDTFLLNGTGASINGGGRVDRGRMCDSDSDSVQYFVNFHVSLINKSE